MLLCLIEAATGDLARLVDGDAFAVHLPVADQKARRCERGDATADEIGRLLVHALRLAGTNECFVVTVTVEHISAALISAIGLQSNGQCVLRPDLHLTNLLAFC